MLPFVSMINWPELKTVFAAHTYSDVSSFLRSTPFEKYIEFPTDWKYVDPAPVDLVNNVFFVEGPVAS